MNQISESNTQEERLLGSNISYDNQGALRTYFFLWILKIFKQGVKSPLTQKVIPKIPVEHSSQASYKNYLKKYQLQENIKDALRKSQQQYIFSTCTMYWLVCTIQLCLPYLMSQAQEYFVNSDTSYTVQNILIFALIQFCYYATISIFQPIQIFIQSLLSIRIQGALSIQVMEHTLKFPLQRSKNYNSGDLINMLQVDVLQASNYFINKFQIMMIPYQLIGAFMIFYITVRENSLLPAIGVVVQVLFGIIFGYYFGKIQAKFMHAKDERMGGVDEALLQVKQIKFNCYEQYFEDRIDKLRQTELKYLKQQVILLIAIQFIQNMLSFATWECTFLFADHITFAITTVIIQNSSQLMYLLQNFPNQLKNYYASQNSIIRIDKFLKEKTITPWSSDENSNLALKLDGTFNWQINDDEQLIANTIQTKLEVQKGKFIVILGNSASGKSTLLKSIINETKCVNGQVFVNGTLSLASQEPWIISDTIKNNITYLNKFDEQRYKQVVKVCALEQDIGQFVNGEYTLLSEKGDNLSGGQQKRINLARAVYNDSDIYLFDDPLSALDIKVRCHIYNECFLKFLKGKTRILFTNSMNNLQGVDEVYCMENGNLVQHNHQISNIEQKLFQIDTTFEEKNYIEVSQPQKASFSLNNEDQRVGNIDKKVIQQIFQYQGGIKALIVIIVYFSVLMVLSTLSSKVLSNPDLSPEEFRTVALFNFPLFNIPIYIAIISITGYFLLVGISTSSVIHKDVFKSLMKASFTQFYNQILIGRLMNRLSKDIYNIDMQFPTQIYNLSIQFTNLIMPLITSLIFLNAIAYPIVLIFVISLLVFTYSYYKCLTEMTRIESVSKSPVFSYFQQIVRGLLYVRTCLSKKSVLLNHQNNIDLDLGNQMYLIGLQQWFSQASGIITNFFQAILFIVCLLYPNGNPAMTYLVVIQMSNVSQLLVQVALSQGNLLMYSISFERCLHLANDIDQEDYESGQIIESQEGEIVLSNSSFQYPNNQKDVLSNINLSIAKGEKIGIVGRTGAGKSSIIMALIRMIVNTNGETKVDGHDINTYKIRNLRRKFSIIPQESLLFKGTLRENLDPLNQYEDSLLLKICETCKLNMESLNTKILQNGCNLSSGEKQLVTIARCMIENRNLVLVDEATANIDQNTEELIKQIFTHHFVDKTMITIAHKVTTIMESDRIVVLSGGKIIECDSPKKLLSQVNSEFRTIVDLINQNL